MIDINYRKKRKKNLNLNNPSEAILIDISGSDIDWIIHFIASWCWERV